MTIRRTTVSFDVPPNSAGADTAAEPTPLDPPRRRSIFPPLAIGFTVALALGMVALIYYRWVTQSEPSSVIEITADPGEADVLVSITHDSFAGTIETLYSQRVGQMPGDRQRVYLNPGTYTVTATRDNGSDAVKLEVSLRANDLYPLDLAGRMPARSPPANSTPPVATP